MRKTEKSGNEFQKIKKIQKFNKWTTKPNVNAMQDIYE